MEKLKKFKDKKYMFPALVVLVVLLLITLPFIIDASRRSGEAEASIIAGTVGRSDITTTISGTGTLTDEEAFEIDLPEGVRLKDYLVKNGDIVKEGDPLAVVDKTSVMEVISTVQENLEYIEEEMSSVSTQYGETYISSSVSGTVKELYAQSGDSVRDIMLSNGALALISIDGLMAVDLSSDEKLSAGDTVSVIFPDKREISGTVKTALEDKVTVTFADKGYKLGETVELSTSSGKVLGSGEIYLNRAWKATAFTGTVSGVYIYEGSTVYSGSTLFYLSDTDYTSDYELLAARHREYEELMSELVQMYQDEYIKAPADGMVSGIDENTVELLRGENKGIFATLLSVTPISLDGSIIANPLSSDNTGGDAPENNSDPTPLPAVTTAPEATETPVPTLTPSPTVAPTATVSPTATVAPTAVPEATFSPAPTASAVPVPSSSVTPTPTESPEAFAYINYVGVVTGSGSARINPVAVTVADYTRYSSSITEDSMTQDISFPTDSVYAYSESSWVSYSAATGDMLLFVYDSNGFLVAAIKIYRQDSAPEGGTGGSTQTGGGNMGGAVEEEQFEMFPLDGTVIMSVTPMEKMTVNFTVDELDILSLAKGQEAMLTIDALPGQSFSGEVTEINTSGENRKYSVSVTLERGDKMLAGMNASVVISIETRENVLSVPVKAQVNIGGHTYLYTAYDKKTGELSAPVEIKTGSSDGEMVEVVSGMDEGGSFWFAYYDTLPEQFPFN